MAERLAELMRAEADALDIPVPPASDMYAQGRRLRRRKQLTVVVAAAAVLAVVGAGTTVAVQSFGGGDGDRASEIDAAAQAAYVEGASLTVDNTVYLGDRTTAEVKDDVHSLHYTSAGLLVRTNKNDGASDGSGPESYTLVKPDGSTKEFGVLTEEQTPSTDPTQPYLAWTTADGGAVTVVLLDVRSGEEKRVPVPGTHEWGGWIAPPVSLSGDIVYVGTNEAILMVNWRTGDVAPSEHLEGGFPDVEGGRFTTVRAGKSVVADAESGQELLTSPGQGGFDLSPDGRFATYAGGPPMPGEQSGGFYVYAVETGERVELPGMPFDYGWTADGHLFTLDEGEVKTCDPVTGECATAYEVPAPDNAHIRLGGMTHES